MEFWKETIRTLGTQLLDKKFLVFVVATALFYLRLLSENAWLYATGAFLAAGILESKLK